MKLLLRNLVAWIHPLGPTSPPGELDWNGRPRQAESGEPSTVVMAAEEFDTLTLTSPAFRARAAPSRHGGGP